MFASNTKSALRLTPNAIAATAYISKLTPIIARNACRGPLVKCDMTYPRRMAARPYRIRIGSMIQIGPFHVNCGLMMAVIAIAIAMTNKKSNVP